METSDWIAIAAVLIAAFSWISQYRLSKKANEATKISNDIQAEMLTLSAKVEEFEDRKGEVLLLNIIGRYFVINYNFLSTTDDRQLEVDKKKYSSGLMQLSMDFEKLIDNPYFIKFIEAHPDINLLMLSLKGAIINESYSTGRVINAQTFNFFYDMYFVLKDELKNKEMLNHRFFKVVQEAIISMKLVLKENENPPKLKA